MTHQHFSIEVPLTEFIHNLENLKEAYFKLGQELTSYTAQQLIDMTATWPATELVAIEPHTLANQYQAFYSTQKNNSPHSVASEALLGLVIGAATLPFYAHLL
ncbi:hypothetical protein [Endozoicomonas sp. Mp262]|uniref:hypothetical protein n=1 Tax=Endozoicomonas sp. Mp262 TaxID=2919499 RepID=UPI0021D7F5F7